MGILVVTIGSRGDVQPYINLCQGLKEAGHEVKLATNPTLCPLVEAHNLTSVPIGSPVNMSALGERIMEQSFNNMYVGVIRVMRFAAKMVEEAYPDVLKVSDGADLVIVSDTGSGSAAAEKLGVPWISVTLQPMRVPKVNPNPPFLWSIFGGLFDKLTTFPINRSRKRMGAPLVTDFAGMQSKRMLLLPVNHHVAAADPQWPVYVHQTNYWYARPLSDWSPPQDLLDFINDGDKPIAVSLGVMSTSLKGNTQTADKVIQAIHQSGVRAIVQGWDEICRQSSPDKIYYAESMPHDWLFSQVRAVIHHGGFGTTAAVFRAGVPGIVIPHVLDQFYWGDLVFRLGLGPKYISRAKLKTAELRQAIFQALSNEQMRERAAELGKNIRDEPDGVATAVSLIEKSFDLGAF